MCTCEQTELTEEEAREKEIKEIIAVLEDDSKEYPWRVGYATGALKYMLYGSEYLDEEFEKRKKR